MTMDVSRSKLIILAILTEGIVFCIAIVLATVLDIALFPLTIDLLNDIAIATVGAVFPILLFIFSLSEKAQSLPLVGSLRKTVITDIKALFANSRLVDLLIISIFAGFAEELLFRGVLQVKFGIVTASILFGLAHFVTPAYAVIATLMGFYIGGFFQFSGSLLIPIHIHFFYDFCALVYLRYVMKHEQ